MTAAQNANPASKVVSVSEISTTMIIQVRIHPNESSTARKEVNRISAMSSSTATPTSSTITIPPGPHERAHACVPIFSFWAPVVSEVLHLSRIDQIRPQARVCFPQYIVCKVARELAVGSRAFGLPSPSCHILYRCSI